MELYKDDSDKLPSFEYIQDKFLKDCPYVARGGKPDPCPDGDCDCFNDDGMGCMFGICVCLYKEHLVFNHTICYNIEKLNHYENVTQTKLQCPRTCRATDENNTCMKPLKHNPKTGRCECPDGTPVIPKITNHFTLDTASSWKACKPINATLPPPTLSPDKPPIRTVTVSIRNMQTRRDKS